jgi:hypothetical protein
MTTKPQIFRTSAEAMNAVRIMSRLGWTEVRLRMDLGGDGFKVVGRSPEGNSGAYCTDGTPHTNYALLGFAGRD